MGDGMELRKPTTIPRIEDDRHELLHPLGLGRSVAVEVDCYSTSRTRPVMFPPDSGPIVLPAPVRHAAACEVARAGPNQALRRQGVWLQYR